MPAFTADGTAGWADAAVPFPPQAYNHVRKELKAILEMLGGTENPLDGGQIAPLLGPKFAGIVSAAIDTGPVTTAHTRTVVGASDSRASGPNSGVSSGQYNEVRGEASQIDGGWRHVVAGERSHVAGGKNIKIQTGDTIAFGAGTVAPDDDLDVNQGMSIRFHAPAGGAHFKGKVYFGGNPNGSNGLAFDGDGALASVDAATGAASFAGGNATIGATGLVSVAHGGTSIATFGAGVNWNVTNNAPQGLISITNDSNMEMADGGFVTVTLTNSVITGDDFTIIPVVRASNTVKMVPISTVWVLGTGTVFTFMNVGAAALVGDTWGFNFKFVAIGAL
jgi:hypothetical protein